MIAVFLPMCNDFVKIIGVIFDDILNLEKHINRVMICYANLCNLGRIASNSDLFIHTKFKH